MPSKTIGSRSIPVNGSWASAAFRTAVVVVRGTEVVDGGCPSAPTGGGMTVVIVVGGGTTVEIVVGVVTDVGGVGGVGGGVDGHGMIVR